MAFKVPFQHYPALPQSQGGLYIARNFSEVEKYVNGIGISPPSATFPTNPVDNQLFWESDTDKLWVYTSPNWVELARSGAWTAYAPTASGVTNVTTSGAWTRSGRTIHGYAYMIGTASTGVSGRYGLTLPFAPASSNVPLISGRLLNAGAYEYAIVGRFGDGGGSQIMFMHAVDSTGVGVVGDGGGTLPFSFGNTDSLEVAFMYQAATSV